MINEKKLYKKLAANLKKHQEGVALIEFAITAPVLIGLLLSSVDITSYLVAHQRVSRASYTMSNLLTQMDKGLSESQVSDMMLALDEVSKPFSIGTDGIATMTAIVGEDNGGANLDYKVAWQRCYGPNTHSDRFGNAGTAVLSADIPTNTIVTDGQIIVITEIDYTFTPMIGFLPIGGQIKYESSFRPRRGTIENIVADGAPAQQCT